MQQAFAAARNAFRVGITQDMQILEQIAAGGLCRQHANQPGQDARRDEFPKALGVPTSAELFEERNDLIYGASAIRYPVFAAGKNYGGGNPRVDQSAMLSRYVRERLGAELAAIPNALVLPLGNAVEGYLRMLIAESQLDETRCLFGFQHPSGANGHRAAYFRRREEMLRTEIKRWGRRIPLNGRFVANLA